jgi:hypothetical protein
MLPALLDILREDVSYMQKKAYLFIELSIPIKAAFCKKTLCSKSDEVKGNHL